MTTLENLNAIRPWKLLLETIVLSDSCAPASILSYYLDDVEDNGSIFCPLGYEPYKVIGYALRADTEAFDAAIDSGLMRSAIGTYVNAALDVWENWDLMKNGVLHLMSNPRLRVFVSCHNRVYIERLKDISDESEWYKIADELGRMLNHTIPKGY